MPRQGRLKTARKTRITRKARSTVNTCKARITHANLDFAFFQYYICIEQTHLDD